MNSATKVERWPPNNSIEQTRSAGSLAAFEWMCPFPTLLLGCNVMSARCNSWSLVGKLPRDHEDNLSHVRWQRSVKDGRSVSDSLA